MFAELHAKLLCTVCRLPNKVKMKNRICSLGNNVANYAHFFGNSPFFGTFSRNKDQMQGIFQNLPLKLEL